MCCQLPTADWSASKLPLGFCKGCVGAIDPGASSQRSFRLWNTYSEIALQENFFEADSLYFRQVQTAEAACRWC